MGTHDPAIGRISPTLPHGVTRRLSDDCYPRSVREAQTSQHARSWPVSGPSKKTHTHVMPRIASQSCDYAAGGEFSAGSDGAAGAGAAGSSTLVDSNAITIMRFNNKRHRAEDAVEGTVPAKRLRRCDDDFRRVRDNMPNSSSPPSSTSSSANNTTRASSSYLSKWQSPRTSPLGPKSSTYCRRSWVSPQPRRAPNKVCPPTRWQCIMQNLVAEYVCPLLGGFPFFRCP